jgi:hypothetical protein
VRGVFIAPFDTILRITSSFAKAMERRQDERNMIFTPSFDTFLKTKTLRTNGKRQVISHGDPMK